MTKFKGPDSASKMIYREHAPMYQLLSKIPTRIHRGVMGYDLNLTCLAAHPSFLAIGTNAGLVYWYDRKNDKLIRLWCADRKTPVTKVALVETVDFMLAVGNKDGVLTIFQIPRPVDYSLFPSYDSDLPEPSSSLQQMPQPEAEIFTIQHVHTKAVTALEWSRNGMKLFSGDRAGQVCLSEIDFDSHCTSSKALCRESEEIVQLSYSMKYLLVSTLRRSVVLETDLATSEEVGQKPRKINGLFGGVFTRTQNKCLEFVVVRPRNTLYWATLKTGQDSSPSVQSTILLDSLLKRPHPDIPLVNPAIFSSTVADDDSIALIRPMLGKDTFVAHSSSTFHIIRPCAPAVDSSCRGLRNIVDLSTTSSSGASGPEEEIFVLEGARNVVRIAAAPDVYQLERSESEMLGLNPLGSEVPEGGAGLESVSSSLLSVLPSMVSDSALGSAASTAFSSLGEKLNQFYSADRGRKKEEPRSRSASPARDVIAEAEENEVLKQFREISNQGLEAAEVSERKRARKKGKKKESCPSTEDEQSLNEERLDELYDEPQDCGRGIAVDRGVLGNLRLELCSPEMDPAADSQGNFLGSEEGEIALESLEAKEEQLAGALELNLYWKSSLETAAPVATDAETHGDKHREKISWDSHQTVSSTDSVPPCKSLAYGPPSESSILSHCPCPEVGAADGPGVLDPFSTSNADLEHEEPLESVTTDKHWMQTLLPAATLSSMAVCSDRVYFTDPQDGVYMGQVTSDKLTWRRPRFQASQVATSPSGQLLWRVHQGRAFAAKDPAVVATAGAEAWYEVVSERVRIVAVNEFSACIGKDGGELLMMKDLSAARPFTDRIEDISLADEILVDVALANGILVGVTEAGFLVGRIGVSRTNPSGSGWVRIESVGCRCRSVHAVEQLVGTRFVYKLVIVTATGRDVMYAHGSQDDLLFDKDLQWFQIPPVQGVGDDEHHQVTAKFSDYMLYICSSTRLYCNAMSFCGLHWRQLTLTTTAASVTDRSGCAARIKDLNAGGIYQHLGVLWLSHYSLKPNVSDLMCTRLHDNMLRPVKLPASFHLSGLCVAPEALWAVSMRGEVLMRKGVTQNAPEGTGWAKMDTTQLREAGATLQGISLGGSDAAWAVDTLGRAWFRLGSLRPEKLSSSSVPAWIPVENTTSPSETPRLSKICASPSSIHIVWALDADVRGGVYVRQGIFPDFRLGIDWVPVGGICDGDEVVSLSASENFVWGLTRSGRLYKRIGITSCNFIGDSWQAVPTAAESVITSLSVTVCDQPFALDKCGKVAELQRQEISLSVPKTRGTEHRIKNAEVTDEGIDDGGWAIVE